MDLTVFLEINFIIVYYNNMLLCVQQMFYFPFKNKFPLMKAVRSGETCGKWKKSI
jgi:hypothetical protein